VLSIRIDNGALLAGKVRVLTTFWQRHQLCDRQHLSADQGLLLLPGGSIHSFGMPCAMDAVFLDRSWRVLELRSWLPPARWVWAPRSTQAVLLLAAGRCGWASLERGMTLCQDAATARTLPFATTVLRRRRSAMDK
jgi:uncharacterized membrane protein (UPF0127 family)